jgi:cytochrome c
MNSKSILGIFLLGSIATAHAAALSDADAKQLAQKSGCVACHRTDLSAPPPGAGTPIGPDWAEVAKKYAGNPHAKHLLVPIVMNGSSPYESHWKGKVTGYAMPPNHVAISEGDADKLVDWILTPKH